MAASSMYRAARWPSLRAMPHRPKPWSTGSCEPFRPRNGLRRRRSSWEAAANDRSNSRGGSRPHEHRIAVAHGSPRGGNRAVPFESRGAPGARRRAARTRDSPPSGPAQGRGCHPGDDRDPVARRQGAEPAGYRARPSGREQPSGWGDHRTTFRFLRQGERMPPACRSRVRPSSVREPSGRER